MSWKLMIHGGCGAMRPATVTPEQEEQARAGLGAALDAGEAVLVAGGGIAAQANPISSIKQSKHVASNS